MMKQNKSNYEQEQGIDRTVNDAWLRWEGFTGHVAYLRKKLGLIRFTPEEIEQNIVNSLAVVAVYSYTRRHHASWRGNEYHLSCVEQVMVAEVAVASGLIDLPDGVSKHPVCYEKDHLFLQSNEWVDIARIMNNSRVLRRYMLAAMGQELYNRVCDICLSDGNPYPLSYQCYRYALMCILLDEAHEILKRVELKSSDFDQESEFHPNEKLQILTGDLHRALMDKATKAKLRSGDLAMWIAQAIRVKRGGRGALPRPECCQKDNQFLLAPFKKAIPVGSEGEPGQQQVMP